MSLTEHMGQLLGPKPVLELVITHYEDDKLNYQFEGFGRPANPGHVLKLLELIHQEVSRQVEAPK